ncbi:hypothetical protein JB92DRAFT_3139325 [Gautieria morchelliformis]|nr:hypothetical protein JB92DRAFT_3139325 [Gautieria morchelliformis]
MLRLSRILLVVKQAVIRGVARHSDMKLPSVEGHVELKKDVTSAPWLALDPIGSRWLGIDQQELGPSALFLLPTSSATSSMFSEDNSSTVRVLAMPPRPYIPNIVVQSENLHTGVIPPISDYDAEKASHLFLKKKQQSTVWRFPCFDEEEERYS